jgi:histidine triad (HIT) family protein
MEDCIFCKVVKGDLPSKKEYEDGDILAIRDINPKAPIHILLISKKHIKNLSEMTEGDIQLIGRMNLVARQIAKKLGIPDQFKLTTNAGAFAGQVVMHLHYHLLGGWSKKKDVISELKI